MTYEINFRTFLVEPYQPIYPRLKQMYNGLDIIGEGFTLEFPVKIEGYGIRRCPNRQSYSIRTSNFEELKQEISNGIETLIFNEIKTEKVKKEDGTLRRIDETEENSIANQYYAFKAATHTHQKKTKKPTQQKNETRKCTGFYCCRPPENDMDRIYTFDNQLTRNMKEGVLIIPKDFMFINKDDIIFGLYDGRREYYLGK